MLLQRRVRVVHVQQKRLHQHLPARVMKICVSIRDEIVFTEPVFIRVRVTIVGKLGTSQTFWSRGREEGY